MVRLHTLMETNNCKERCLSVEGTATRPPHPCGAPLLENKEGRIGPFSPPYFQGGVDAQRTGWFRPEPKINTRCTGFTLLELIATMLILSVLAVTVSMRWGATDATISYQADLLARNIRHTQMLAMTWGQSLKVNGAGAGYTVTCVSGTPTPPCNLSPVTDPATGGAFSVTLSNNVAVSATSVDIDSLGRPLSAGALLTTTRVFTFSGAGQTWSVRVAPITGFVSVTSP